MNVDGFVQREEVVMQKIVSFLKDESGASAGEYALILAIIGTAVALAAFTLGGDLSTGMGAIGDCIATPPADGTC
jgi:pilus assembly protein Flp/PilA